MQRILVLIATLISVGIAKAAQPTPQHVSTQISHQNVELTYYEAGASKLPAAGTILYLCGGPGIACSNYLLPDSIPPEFNVVYFDYIGLGTNGQYQDLDLIDFQAQGEAISVIFHEIKDSKVIIYGHSFGTTLATVAASLISNQADPKLKAVVLEGTVGPGLHEQTSGYLNVEANTWNLLSNNEKQTFVGAVSEFSRALDAKQKYGLNLYLTLSLSSGADGAAEILKQFSADVKSSPAAIMGYIDIYNSVYQSLFSMKMASVLGCQIFQNPTRNQQTLFGGSVVLNDGFPVEFCSFPQIQNKWDPAKYQIINNVPIFYAQGSLDPNTPLNWAKEHFASQTSSGKKLMFISVDGGHDLLEKNSPLANYSNLIFSELIQDRYQELQIYLEREAHVNPKIAIFAN